MADALFEPRDASTFEPTDLARGPWSPDALHGGPVAALLARALERLDAPGPMIPARLTVELLRPVPLAPLRVTTEVFRPGKKIQLADAFLHAGATEVARARLLRIRSAQVPLPATLDLPSKPPFALPAESAPIQPQWARDEARDYHSYSTEHRAARGGWGTPGPIVDWIRMRYPVVAGEETSPFQRVAGVADFGNGVSWVLPYGDYMFINADLTIHLNRLPRGEWVCLDAVTHPGAEGVGIAESALWDEGGRIGRSVQSLLLERR
ncbi:MAG TPA: thioesterase family protein [Candidatus Binatia bacterium]|nr:thioesterase family protein [Candidatus Binatia bacterium]